MIIVIERFIKWTPLFSVGIMNQKLPADDD